MRCFFVGVVLAAMYGIGFMLDKAYKAVADSTYTVTGIIAVEETQAVQKVDEAGLFADYEYYYLVTILQPNNQIVIIRYMQLTPPLYELKMGTPVIASIKSGVLNAPYGDKQFHDAVEVKAYKVNLITGPAFLDIVTLVADIIWEFDRHEASRFVLLLPSEKKKIAQTVMKEVGAWRLQEVEPDMIMNAYNKARKND